MDTVVGSSYTPQFWMLPLFFGAVQMKFEILLVRYKKPLAEDAPVYKDGYSFSLVYGSEYKLIENTCTHWATLFIFLNTSARCISKPKHLKTFQNSSLDVDI